MCRHFTGPVLAAILVSVLSVVNESALAQQTVTSATISGRVVDVGGASLSGVNLTATNAETNQRYATTADHDGRYRFPLLQVGNYSLQVEVPGFAPWTKVITVTVGQALDLPIKLEVAGVSVNVDISSDVPLIETVRTQVTETIRPAEINSLPLNTRNYLDLALLIPGVSPTNTGSNQRFAETSAIPGQGISIAGQRNLYNSFVVDGLSANDDAADLTGKFRSVIYTCVVCTSLRRATSMFRPFPRPQVFRIRVDPIQIGEIFRFSKARASLVTTEWCSRLQSGRRIGPICACLTRFQKR